MWGERITGGASYAGLGVFAGMSLAQVNLVMTIVASILACSLTIAHLYLIWLKIKGMRQDRKDKE